MSAHIASAALNIRENISLLRRTRFNVERTGEEERKIIIGWIPSHKGIMGNELPDQMAKGATKSEHDGRIKVPFADWKAINKEEMRNRARARNEKEGAIKGIKYFKEVHSRSKNKPWFSGINAERRFVTTVNRIRANHINLKESLSRKGYTESSLCDCGRTEDLRHVLFECEKYIRARDEFYGRLERLKVPYSYDVEEWTARLRIRPLEEMVNFLKKIKKIV